MKDKLQEALVDVIESATEGVKDGVSFLSAELPDVISQLLMWEMTASLIRMLIGLLIFAALIATAIKIAPKCGRGDKAGHKYRWRRYEPTLTHDDSGEVSLTAILMIVPTALILMVSVMLMNLTWLKIWIAPKVYLIEYAATLVK